MESARQPAARSKLTNQESEHLKKIKKQDEGGESSRQNLNLLFEAHQVAPSFNDSGISGESCASREDGVEAADDDDDDCDDIITTENSRKKKKGTGEDYCPPDDVKPTR